MRRLSLAIAAFVALAGCGGGGASAADRKLVVFAATSLTDSFERIGRDFEASHEGIDVEFQFAGSQQLVAQLDQGAAADVLVTADEVTMTRAVDGRLVTGEPVEIARNLLTIVVPRGNPMTITGLADLALSGVEVVLAAPEVPAGRYSRLALARAGVSLRPVSEEPSVKAVLSKVELGEADAGVVYVSDVKGRSAVEPVGIDPAHNVEATYLAATTAAAASGDAASTFLGVLTEEDAQRHLTDAGFLAA